MKPRSKEVISSLPKEALASASLKALKPFLFPEKDMPAPTLRVSFTVRSQAREGEKIPESLSLLRATGAASWLVLFLTIEFSNSS